MPEPKAITKAKGGKGIEATLSKKYGPLPLWGWGALALGAYFVYKNVYAPNQAANSGQTQAPADVGQPSFADTGGVSGGGGGFDSGGGAPATGNLPADTGATTDQTAPTVNITEPTINIKNVIPRPKRRHHRPPVGQHTGGHGPARPHHPRGRR